jgi:hypothetical protein
MLAEACMAFPVNKCTNNRLKSKEGSMDFKYGNGLSTEAALATDIFPECA